MSKIKPDQLIFVLSCMKSDYPHHFVPGIRYKVDVNDKNDDKEVAVYWFHPLESKWVFIGYCALDCFDVDPIKKYLAEKKGLISVASTPVRQRIEIAIIGDKEPAKPIIGVRSHIDEPADKIALTNTVTITGDSSFIIRPNHTVPIITTAVMRERTIIKPGVRYRVEEPVKRQRV